MSYLVSEGGCDVGRACQAVQVNREVPQGGHELWSGGNFDPIDEDLVLGPDAFPPDRQRRLRCRQHDFEFAKRVRREPSQVERLRGKGDNRAGLRCYFGRGCELRPHLDGVALVVECRSHADRASVGGDAVAPQRV